MVKERVRTSFQGLGPVVPRSLTIENVLEARSLYAGRGMDYMGFLWPEMTR